jgi:hypothetical protein
MYQLKGDYLNIIVCNNVLCFDFFIESYALYKIIMINDKIMIKQFTNKPVHTFSIGFLRHYVFQYCQLHNTSQLLFVHKKVIIT